jgi:hypothetical protein
MRSCLPKTSPVSTTRRLPTRSETALRTRSRCCRDGVLLRGADGWAPHRGSLDAVRHRRPRRRRIVRGDFIEPVDPVHGEHASLLIDGELVVLGRVDLFAVEQPDNEHDAVLSSERGLARRCDRPGAGPDPLLGGGVNGGETLYDNQSRARPGGNGARTTGRRTGSGKPESPVLGRAVRALPRLRSQPQKVGWPALSRPLQAFADRSPPSVHRLG